MDKKKRSFWKSPEFWISISATITALISLIFTITESKRSQEHQRRSTLPLIGVTFYFTKDEAGFSMGNRGLDPGRLKWFQVIVDEKPQPNWRSMLEQLGFDPVPNYGFIILDHGLWWTVGDIREIFKIQGKPNQIRMIQESSRIKLSGCYCSFYNQCWIFHLSSEKPVEVSSCEPKPEITLSVSPPSNSK